MNLVNKSPLITIITVVYNGAKYIEDTINSVLNQSYTNIEYIIIDGGSTDGTINIIKKYENKIDYWVSEKDKGISDAFNKGLSKATGDIIGLINADDYYNDNTVDLIVKNYNKNIDIYYGSIIKIDNSDNKIYLKSSKDALKSIDKCNMQFIYHPTFFITSKLYKKYGYFNNDYNLAMDYEFLSRIDFKKIKSCYIESYLTIMRMDGISDIFNYKAKLEVINAYRKRNSILFDLYIFKEYYQTVKSYIRYKLTNYKLGRKLIEFKRKITK
jgi:glycosyltransferase involved in cell wall biosynthesis